jgi:DNA-binding transcriptional LysR family regulator
MHLKIAFDAFLPGGRWAALFHVLCLEQPGVRLAWRATGFPTVHRSLLEGVDVGLLVEPPPEAGIDALTIDTGPMAVTMAVGHPLARAEGLSVAEILDEPFAVGPDVHPEWCAFWTLDERRGGPPALVDERVDSAERGAELVASGRAIATVPACVADSLPHPGVITIALHDAPMVETRLVWRAEDRSPMVEALIDLSAAWSTRAIGRDGAGG